MKVIISVPMSTSVAWMLSGYEDSVSSCRMLM